MGSRAEVPLRDNCFNCHLIRIGTFKFMQASADSRLPQFMEVYTDRLDIWLYPGIQISILNENIKKVWKYTGRGVPKAFFCILVDPGSSQRILKCLQAKFRNTMHFRKAEYDSLNDNLSKKFISIFPVDFSAPKLKNMVDKTPYLSRGAKLTVDQVREFVLCISGTFQQELSFNLYLPMDFEKSRQKMQTKALAMKNSSEEAEINAEEKTGTVGACPSANKVPMTLPSQIQDMSTYAEMDNLEPNPRDVLEMSTTLLRVTTKVIKPSVLELEKNTNQHAQEDIDDSIISSPKPCTGMQEGRSVLRGSIRSVLKHQTPGQPSLDDEEGEDDLSPDDQEQSMEAELGFCNVSDSRSSQYKNSDMNHVEDQTSVIKRYVIAGGSELDVFAQEEVEDNLSILGNTESPVKSQLYISDQGVASQVDLNPTFRTEVDNVGRTCAEDSDDLTTDESSEDDNGSLVEEESYVILDDGVGPERSSVVHIELGHENQRAGVDALEERTLTLSELSNNIISSVPDDQNLAEQVVLLTEVPTENIIYMVDEQHMLVDSQPVSVDSLLGDEVGGDPRDPLSMDNVEQPACSMLIQPAGHNTNQVYLSDLNEEFSMEVEI